MLATPHPTPARRGPVESPVATSKARPAAQQQVCCHVMSLLIPSMEGTFRASSQRQNTPSTNTSLRRSHRATREPLGSRWQLRCDIPGSCRQSHPGQEHGLQSCCLCLGTAEPQPGQDVPQSSSSCTSHRPSLGAPPLHLVHLQGPTRAKLVLHTSHKWT